MPPQVGAGFNRGIWRSLETRVRTLAHQEADLVVITGPVFYDLTPTIGDGVIVPDAFFKIIYAPASNRTWAYLIPNQVWKGATYEEFSVTIQPLENLTGYDFFNEKAMVIETALEATPPPPVP